MPEPIKVRTNPPEFVEKMQAMFDRGPSRPTDQVMQAFGLAAKIAARRKSLAAMQPATNRAIRQMFDRRISSV